jgi:CRISPR system Cascade subunit CasE
MALYLCRQHIDLGKLYQWAGRRKLFSGAFDEGYALHALLTENLGDHAPQPFRLIHTPRAKTGTLYGYSPHSASQINQTAAEIAEPDFQQITSTVMDKEMPCTWQEGKRFGFDIKIRPTSRFRDTKGNMIERDAFLSHVNAFPDDKSIDRNQVYAAWLAERLANNGALLTEDGTINMPTFRRCKIVRKRGCRGRSEGPDCVLRGVLEVTDQAAFNQLLGKGAGRHKAYGYGMLLLRPARIHKTC